MPDWPYLAAFVAGQTLAGIPLVGGLVWLVSRFAFRKSAALDRARLTAASTYLVIAALGTWNGDILLAIGILPSFLIVWLIYRALVLRRQANSTDI